MPNDGLVVKRMAEEERSKDVFRLASSISIKPPTGSEARVEKIVGTLSINDFIWAIDGGRMVDLADWRLSMDNRNLRQPGGSGLARRVSSKPPSPSDPVFVVGRAKSPVIKLLGKRADGGGVTGVSREGKNGGNGF